MSARDKKYLVGGAILFVLASLFFVNFFIYPFKAQEPNFSDVEQVFARIQIPSDWQQIDSSENRGRFGRTCPIESSGCFSKTAQFKLNETMTVDFVKELLLSSGCPGVSVMENKVVGETKSWFSLKCSTVEAVNVVVDLDYIRQDLNVVVSTD